MSGDSSHSTILGSGGFGRRGLLRGSAALAAGTLARPNLGMAQSQKSPLAGKSIHMQILGVAGWLPSKLGVDMSPEFAKYAKDKYGYDVSFSFADAPFGTLFQKAATSLATRSQEYNIIISDSQWLGALATPKWIVQINDIIAKNPELNIEWWSPIDPRPAIRFSRTAAASSGAFRRSAMSTACSSARISSKVPARPTLSRPSSAATCPKTWDDFEKMDYDQWIDLLQLLQSSGEGLSRPCRAILARVRRRELPDHVRDALHGRRRVGSQDRAGAGHS